MPVLTLVEPFVSTPVAINGIKSGTAIGNLQVNVDEPTALLYRQTKKSMHREGRNDQPQWNGTTVVEPSDQRPRVRISHDGATHPQLGVPVLLANNTDTITVTFEKLLAGGAVDTGFNGNRIFELDNGQAWRIDFTNGVGTKAFTTRQSGYHDLFSPQPRYRLEGGEIRFLAVE